MSNVIFDSKEFENLLGRKLNSEIERKISLFGTPLEKITKEEIEIEIFPNRPDLLSLHGYIRGFKAFLGKETGLKKYFVQKPSKNYEVKILPSTKLIRPFTACAIIKNLKLDSKKIKSIIDLQEKLHFTIGRNRKKIAIGIYPLEKISLPITFEALPPSKIRFIPLDMEKEVNANQILKSHPTGRNYSHLLEDKELFPVFKDSNGKILSMPPIINSNDTGKVSLETKEVFVECSGFDFELLKKTLNIISTTLAEMGGEINQVILNYENKKIITPNLTPETIKISLDNVNKLLGLSLKENELQDLLNRMGYGYKNKTVSIPPWRVDILHEVDIIEDVLISYGYDKITPEIPSISTIGEELPETNLKKEISELLIGLNFTEISTYHLIKKEELQWAETEEVLELEDSKTEYKYLRPNLIIPGLRILSENKDNEYPQNIFEIGTVFNKDELKKSETGVEEKLNLCILSCPANFTKIKQVLNYLSKNLSIDYTFNDLTHPLLIEGRTASIEIGNKVVGYFGEVHPETLRSWGIKMPVAAMEVSLNDIFFGLK